MIKTNVFRTILFMFVFSSAQAQIVINEWSASNVNTINDNFNEKEDWIELYNTSSNSVDLQGYFLTDKKTNKTKWEFPSVTIPANGYQLIFCSKKNIVVGNFVHTNFKLTQTDYETIVLYTPGLLVLDSVTMIPVLKDHSRGRTTDSAPTWSLFASPTPGAPNANALSGYVPRPEFDTPIGFHSAAINVKITCSDSNAEIRYTTNGDEPTQVSTLYTSPVTMTSTTVLRARAFSNDPTLFPSFIESGTFFINVNHVLPVVSVFGEGLNDLLDGTQFSPTTGIEIYDETYTLMGTSYGDADEHGNDSWAYDQRGLDFIGRDQFGYSSGVQAKIFKQKDREHYQRLILKPAANDNYPFAGGAHIRDAYCNELSQRGNLELDERTNQSCIMYRNGEYWGVYEIREKVDDLDFTSYYYDQDEPNVEFLQTWGGTWAPYGANAIPNWNSFITWVNANNLSLPANYNYIDSVYNIESLTDYFILNSFTVCKDWLNWNTAWWRGLDPAGKKKKWRYTLWDMDATFGHYINYTGVPNTGPSANPCDPNTLNDPGGQGHVPILNKLMQTDTFKVFYINRYVDLVNTVFNCDNMHHVLDSMIAAIEPEMDAQCTKWGGNKSDWQTNVNTLSKFIDDRCVQLTNGFINCYDLKGPYEVQINAIPQTGGVVKFNSLFINDYVWTGKYFGNIKQYLAPIPNPGYHFTHWSIEGDTLFPSTNDSLVYLNIDTNIKVIAHFEYEDTTIKKNEIFVPTAFSPNGDGENDIFKVYGDSISSVTMEVYNRWGEKVFTSNDKNDGWSGTYKDQLLNSDVFTFRIEVVMENKKRISKKGSITLMR